MELLMTADMIKADRALQLGLVNHVVSADELLSKSSEILQKIATKAPLAIAKVIECGNAFFTDGVDGLEMEIDKFGECCATEDFVEGATAFVEKRKADFKGR
jgi:enoyl-CoA hydratase